jgi:hypothetical protein
VAGILHVCFNPSHLPGGEIGGGPTVDPVRSENEGCLDVSEAASGAGGELVAGTGLISAGSIGSTLEPEGMRPLCGLVAASSDT